MQIYTYPQTAKPQIRYKMKNTNLACTVSGNPVETKKNKIPSINEKQLSEIQSKWKTLHSSRAEKDSIQSSCC